MVVGVHEKVPPPVPVMAPQMTVPEESVVRAEVPEQEPNCPSVVEPMLLILKNSVVAPDEVDDATTKTVRPL